MKIRWCVLAVIVAATGVQADDSSAGRACTHIPDDALRLSCFDAAFAKPAHEDAAAAPAAAGTHGLAAAPKSEAEFGDRGQLPAEKAVEAKLPKRVNFKVTKSESLARGLFRLTMDNAQVWVTKDADWALEFKDGDEVSIQRMVLGGYRISHLGQGRNVTVTRIL